MPFQKQSFRKSEDKDFTSVLKSRVNGYFKSRKRSRYGNWSMYIKTIVMFALYLTPYLILLFGGVSNPFIIVGCYVLMGFGMLGIGLGVMHDANHGAYSRRRWVNKYLGYSMNLIGANAEIWKLQHNVLHHSYTNIDGADDDINVPLILRFSTNTKKLWIHKLQFLYAWILYGLTTLSRTSAREFVQAVRYRNLGLVNPGTRFRKLILGIAGWKAFYYMYILILPLIFVPAPFWAIILGYLIMHFVTGVCMSAIFQTAHLVPECSFPTTDENGEIDTSWIVHELKTTSNFAPKSYVFSWMIGGLNYQVEHHLFPNICHVHYRKLSKIVASTAEEFGLPYHSQKSFLAAIWNHTKMLYRLGRAEQALAVAR